MGYVLEGAGEASRLEEQAAGILYLPASELEGLHPPSGPLLDAGTGSGVMARALARRAPGTQVIGCDRSADRLATARELACDLPDLQFVEADLTRLPFKDHQFAGAVSRLVVEHLRPDEQRMALAELFRCVRPGGLVRLIDLDGMYENLYPRPPTVRALLEALAVDGSVDLQVGRKLPWLLQQAGFIDVQWRVEVMAFAGAALDEEIRFLAGRLDVARSFLSRLLGTTDAADALTRDIIATLRTPGSTMFYNKFIVTACRPGEVSE